MIVRQPSANEAVISPLPYVNEALVGALPAFQAVILEVSVAVTVKLGKEPTAVMLYTDVVFGVTVTLPAGV